MLDKWKKRRDEILAAMENIVNTEERSEAATKSLQEYEAELAVLNTQIDDYTRFTEHRAAADTVDMRQVRAAQTERVPAAFGGDELLTFGQQWVASEQFRNYHGHGTSGVLDIDGDQTRAPLLTSTADWDKALYSPQRITIAEATDQFPLFDVCNVETVSTGSVDWVEYGFDDGTPTGIGGPDSSGNAAAVVAEGAGKPESTLVARLREAALDTIAHYVQCSRQSVEDSGRMRQVIDNLLIRGVRWKEHQALAFTLSSAQLPSAVNADLLAAIRMAIAKVQDAGFNPNAVSLHPDDWAELDIGVMGGTLNGPVVRQSFWGLTPIPNSQQTPGSAIVGDFKAGVSHFRRSSIGIYLTDSHASTFTSNIFTVLGEARSKSAIVNPTALCETAAA